MAKMIVKVIQRSVTKNGATFLLEDGVDGGESFYAITRKGFEGDFFVKIGGLTLIEFDEKETFNGVIVIKEIASLICMDPVAA